MSEISQERKAELRAQCEPSITGTHKPVAYWELRTLLDYADERDEAVELLSMARNTMGWIRSTVPMEHVIKHDPSPQTGLWIAMQRIDALLRRVGGSDE